MKRKWFLLLIVLRTAFSCLSNPKARCSVASYMYNSPSCQQMYSDSRSGSVYDTGQYHGFLGDNVQARAYSSNGGNDFAKTDRDLQCRTIQTCKWHNEPDDELDWVSGTGTVDPMKLALITGSNTIPETSFLILASDTRPVDQGGSLISPPIGCQQSSGLLSFRMWRSRARTTGAEPNIDICTRKYPEVTLENCLTVELTDNHTIVASIPPILEPFEIVIRGYGFSNEPEGGLLLVDQIDYFAHVDTPENCVAKNLGKSAEIVPFEKITEAQTLVSSDTAFEEEEDLDTLNSRSTEPRKVARDQTTTSSEGMIVIADESTQESCRTLQCSFDEMSTPCGYIRVGEGARGLGYSVGWKVTQIDSNVANKLTGIHQAPGGLDAHFLVAEFPGFQRIRNEHRFVLESPEFLLSDATEAFLGFRKYLSTQGIEMTVCEDTGMKDCFWDNFQHSSDPFTRAWTMEIVKLPQNINKFYVICTQDLNATANVGQVGISEIGLFADSEATVPLC